MMISRWSPIRRVVQLTRIWTFSPSDEPTGFSRWLFSRDTDSLITGFSVPLAGKRPQLFQAIRANVAEMVRPDNPASGIFNP